MKESWERSLRRPDTEGLESLLGPKIGELAPYLQRKMERGACQKYKYSEIMPTMNITRDQALKLQTLNLKP